MHRVAILALAITTIFCSQTLADQLTLKNGDRLTGKIVKTDGQHILLKSEFAGTVSVQLDAVVKITADDPVYLTLSDGQVIVGTITSSESSLKVEMSEAERVEVSRGDITAIRSEAEQQAYQAQIDRYRHPGLFDLWSGFVDTGLSLTHGNSDTTTFSVGFNADRITPGDKTSVYMTTLHVTSKDIETRERKTTAKAIRGGAHYEVNLSKRLNIFTFGDFEHDKFQDLSLRYVIGGGLNWDLIENERTLLKLFGGSSLHKEYFIEDEDRTSGELLAGEEFSHKVSNRFALKQQLSLFPNLTNRSEYRATFDSSAVTTLNKWLSWHVTLSDRFISNPAAGTQKNDLLLTTGIRLVFKQ